MFEIFTDPVKMAQQMEIILDAYGFAVWETLYALALEVLFAYAIGLPLGVLLVTGEKGGIRPLPGWIMKSLNVIINLLRSVPFLILMIIALPLSKIIVGTKVGTEATIPPMVVAAFPLVARMVESSLREVNQGVIEGAAAGSTAQPDFRRYHHGRHHPGLRRHGRCHRRRRLGPAGHYLRLLQYQIPGDVGCGHRSDRPGADFPERRRKACHQV